MADSFDLFALDRADALLDEIRTAESDYLKTQPYKIDMGMVLAPRVSQVRVFIEKAPPLDPVRSQVGDCLHNIRTTLEYLAMALVEANTPQPAKPDKVQFPIFEDERKFDKQAKGLGEASTAAQAAVRALQPFVGQVAASEHPLALLQRLSNFSKHRKPLSASAVPTGAGFHVVRLSGVNLLVRNNVRFGPFVSGEVIADYQLVPTERDVDAIIEPAFDVVWGFANDSPLPGMPLVKTLERISWHVRSVVVPQLTAHLK